ncbi:MAG: bifunctional ornithine acetyltransferase/N-acetylglutamate synthase [Methanobacteriaceae archaeon]|nr:bifunctional ornithine acetyltransferase/N-acetylglutamate synthase [Methanobacteriaceae archaeon]
MKIIDKGICAVNNIKTNGVRNGKYGISIIYHPNLTTAAVYTSNRIVAAPVTISKKHLSNGKIDAVLINSGNANCYTKQQGIDGAFEMAKLVSDKLSIPIENIALASTGVIGRQMPLDIYNPLIKDCLSKLENSKESSYNSAEALLTTDTITKEIAVEVELNDGSIITIGGMCKGSGMIAPNMGTLLGFITTDLKAEKDELENALRNSVKKSFNMLVIDGDESTNDTVFIMSTNEVEGKIDDNFKEALDYVCITLAKMMAKDAEGANKFMEVSVTGAKTIDDAILASKAVVSSSLVKTAVCGADPNWGRIIDALGYSKATFDPDEISITFKSDDKKAVLVEKGVIKTYLDETLLSKAEKIMENESVYIDIDLNQGEHSITAYGCDLTKEYVRINSEYTT